VMSSRLKGSGDSSGGGSIEDCECLHAYVRAEIVVSCDGSVECIVSLRATTSADSCAWLLGFHIPSTLARRYGANVCGRESLTCLPLRLILHTCSYDGAEDNHGITSILRDSLLHIPRLSTIVVLGEVYPRRWRCIHLQLCAEPFWKPSEFHL
jgi:hypothetical protein